MKRLVLLLLALLGGYAAWRRFTSGPTGPARSRELSPLAPTGPGEEPQVQSFMTVARPDTTADAKPATADSQPVSDDSAPVSDDSTPVPDDAAPAAADPAPVSAEAGYGPGSAAPGPDGSGPDGWTVKGNAGSMLFHTPDSPWYGRTVAEVWFQDEDSARVAGFQHWDRKQR